MPKRKVFLSAGIMSAGLLLAGCGTSEQAAEPLVQSEEAETPVTASSADADEAEEQDEEVETASIDEEAAEQGVPEDQLAITTAFPLGTTLEELMAHYGQPTYDEFFLGSRLVVFNEEDGYFLDSEDTVLGFLIANPDVAIFETRIGMTFEEINRVLGESGEVFFDESETQDYVSAYEVMNYRITFYADTADGPAQYAIVVRSK